MLHTELDACPMLPVLRTLGESISMMSDADLLVPFPWLGNSGIFFLVSLWACHIDYCITYRETIVLKNFLNSSYDINHPFFKHIICRVFLVI